MRLRASLLGLGLICMWTGCGGGKHHAVPDAAVPDAAVDDAGSDSAADAMPAGPSSDELFDPGQIHTFALTIKDADWTWLNDHAINEEYVIGDLRWDSLTAQSIGVRYKGGVGTLQACFDGDGQRVCDKLSMKLKFNEYVPGQRFGGVKHVNLHSMHWDPSQMRDRLAYDLFRDMGVAAPRTAYARVTVNGEDLGLFVLVEDVDEVFVEDRFGAVDGGEGNLYKEVWPTSEFASEAYFAAALRTNESSPDVSRMVAFAAAMQGADDASFRDTLATWTDLPTLTNYLAVDRFIDNWDGIVGWYCSEQLGCYNHNYFWYEQTDANRLWLIPWDMDNTFHSPNPIRNFYNMPDWDASADDCALRGVVLGLQGRPPACDPIIHLMATTLADDYEARTAALLAGPAAEGVLEAKIDALAAQIDGEVASDSHGPDVGTWLTAVANLRAGIANLRARVTPP